MIALSPHFSLDELTFSSTAARLSIDNTPPAQIRENLRNLAAQLERVRSVLGDRPLRIDSGYRCPALNQAVKGAAGSAHVQGHAADFVCPSFGDPLAIVRAIEASPILFDQLIQEGTWVHISFAPALRRQVLTAHFGSGGTTYTMGA